MQALKKLHFVYGRYQNEFLQLKKWIPDLDSATDQRVIIEAESASDICTHWSHDFLRNELVDE